MFKSCTACLTFAMSFSNANSGVCTPSTANPRSRYFSNHARTYGTDRKQLMHEYVQKSTSSTRPRTSAAASGGELSQALAPSRLGMGPSFVVGAGRAGLTPSTNRCSKRDVRANEIRVSTPVSSPNAMAATLASTTMPIPRRTHSSPSSDGRANRINRLPPNITRDSANAAPVANDAKSPADCHVAPLRAAPVRISPRIGPAHGAQSIPVDAPSSIARPIGQCPAEDFSDGPNRPA